MQQLASNLEILVKKAKSGERAVLEKLVAGIQENVYGLALRMLGYPADAEDAAQEILIKEKSIKMKCEHSIEKFTLREKVLTRTTFNLGILIGAYGLYLESGWLAAGYIFFAFIGTLLLMRYTVCPRCPHLYVADDCLVLPVPLASSMLMLM